jgi:ferredoxin-NADP reductase
MSEISATLRELHAETAHATTLRLELGGAPFDYRPGQYIMIDPHQFEELAQELKEKEAHRGKPVGPGYFSLSSDALQPGRLEITVKLPSEGPPGMLPRFLARSLKVGHKVRVSGPGGKYHLPEAPPSDVPGFLHLCAGSGIAPNRGMIRHALARNWPQRHLLLVQDRHEADAIFRKELADLAAQHPDSLHIVRVYSRPHAHLITAEQIRHAAAGYLDLGAVWAFICGPNSPRGEAPGFVERLRRALGLELGFSQDRIRTE